MAGGHRTRTPTGSGVARAFGAVTTATSALCLVAAGVLAPPTPRAPGLALGLVLAVVASAHVAATPWLATLHAARTCAAAQRARLVAAPAVALVTCVAVACWAPNTVLRGCLLAFFSWQLVHFSKQNVGMVALSSTAAGAASPTRTERRWIVASGCTGIAALLARPSLVEIPFAASAVGSRLAATAFGACVVGGLLSLWRSPTRSRRPRSVTASHVVALCFSAPLFLASSPYGALAGMTIAHGLQYLGILGTVAGGPLAARRRRIRAALLVTVALGGGLALHEASPLHPRLPGGHVLFGLYLGAYAAHFLVDATMWRLSSPASRAFVTAALPALLNAVPSSRHAQGPLSGPVELARDDPGHTGAPRRSRHPQGPVWGSAEHRGALARPRSGGVAW